MLAAHNRLRRSEDFRRAVRRGSRASRPTVVVHQVAGHAEPSGELSPRVGLVVSRSVGNAVIRNTVSRRLRHLMRERIDAVPAGATVVVRATPRAATASSAEMGRDLDECLTRVGAGRSTPGAPGARRS